MINFYDIHRHDQFSLFDGMGTAEKVAEKAKELSYWAVGTTNHGNITGLVKHFNACVKYDLIPILGCEFYFQPKIDKEKPYYHLCLFAKSKKGWENLNRLVTVANSEDHFYRHPKICFEDLAKYSEGIICSTACIGGYIPQLLVKGKEEIADKAIKKFKKIYGRDFFFEIMPIELPGEGKGENNLQIKLNEKLLKKAEEFHIYPIATTDSHFIDKNDFPTYLKMHEMKNSELGKGYAERYMPSKKEMSTRLNKYHYDHYTLISDGMKSFLNEIGDARQWLTFEENIPSFTDDPEESYQLMKKKCIKFLKKEGKTSKKYKDRLKHEFSVIKYHGFQDYFLIVQEYVNWAKNNGIAVGPGRGSAGNSLTNYSLGITLVDPIYFDNNFDRFLRKDKKKFPDIDVDFGQDRRDEVIKHIIDTYPGRAAQTLTYGCYNVKNLINDLVKVCGCDNKDDIEDIKKLLSKYCDDNESTIDEGLWNESKVDKYNALYDNIIIHFSKLYGKVRYFGTHASSVILCNGEIAAHAGLCRIGGNLRTSFDLHDIETLKLLKLDILGLSTATKVKKLEDLTGEKFSYSMLEDKKTLKQFEKGNACVFQFESQSANDIAAEIGIDSFEDVVVATSVNRPGPLSLHMHEVYRDAKHNPDTDSPWYKYTKKTYGTLIYQEQGMPICKEIGLLDSDTTDKIVKADYLHIPQDKLDEWHKAFKKGAKQYGLTKEQTETLFNSLIQYSFNRGHGVAYAMLSTELMYFRVHYPLQFWWSTLRYENNEDKLWKEESEAIKDGLVIFPPHVNGSVNYSIMKYKGEEVIQKGLTTIKNVGEKAAQSIIDERKKNGPFKDVFEFEARCKSRSVTTRVIDALEDGGALEFNKKKYLSHVEKYNVAVMIRGSNNGFK